MDTTPSDGMKHDAQVLGISPELLMQAQEICKARLTTAVLEIMNTDQKLLALGLQPNQAIPLLFHMTSNLVASVIQSVAERTGVSVQQVADDQGRSLAFIVGSLLHGDSDATERWHVGPDGEPIPPTGIGHA